MLQQGIQVLRGSFEPAAFLAPCKQHPGCLVPAATKTYTWPGVSVVLSVPSTAAFQSWAERVSVGWVEVRNQWVAHPSQNRQGHLCDPLKGWGNLVHHFPPTCMWKQCKLWHNLGLCYSSEVTWWWDLATRQFHGVFPSYSHPNFIFPINICRISSFRFCL